MSLRLKLVVIILFVALVPLMVSGWMTLRIHQRAVDDRVGELQQRSVQYGAGIAELGLGETVERLSALAATVPWDQLDGDQRTAALWLVYRQHPDVVAVTLLDEAGRGLGPAAYQEEASPEPELAAHPRARVADLQQFAARIPLDATRTAPVGVGEAFTVEGVGAPVVPVALPLRGGRSARAVAVALALRDLCGRAAAGSDDVHLYLVDAADRVLCGGATALATLPGAGTDTLRARVPAGHGWSIVGDQDRRAAQAPARAILGRSLFWVATAFLSAALAGLFLARSITRPVAELVAGAGELGRGNFAHRLPVRGRDELARLSVAFNAMGVEIERREADIQAWNRELQDRVEERTRELREIQAQLLQSQKIAAMGALGAGFAHEINNPLTGVLGLSQVLLAKARQDPARAQDISALAAIEKEALRIRNIVTALVELTQGFGTETGFDPVDVNGVVGEVADLIAERASERGIEVVRRQAAELPAVLGKRAELHQALLHVAENALQAIAKTGRVTFATELVDAHAVRITVEDDGRGIAPEILPRIFEPFFTTKDNWRGLGLGLTVAFSIVERHHGTLKAASRVGQGTTMTITLSAARRAAHLV